MKKYVASMSLVVAVLISGCTTTADTLGANVYDATQLNQQQDAQTVEILHVSPAKVAVDNTENKRIAQAAGGILGAVAGAVIGYNVGSGGSTAGTTAGGVAGGVGGAVAGSMVSDKKIVEGVTIAYRLGAKSKVKTSTQAGRLCEFQTGTALMITTTQNETRIQPNAVCPEKNDKKGKK